MNPPKESTTKNTKSPQRDFFSCLSCFSWTVGISGAVFADIKREKLLSICLVYTGMMAVLMR
jgi:hypothetical protein